MCRCLIKIILFIVNLLFTLIGLALVGIGIAIIINLDDVFDELVNVIPINLKLIPYFVIGIGAVIFLIAFCGCCGSVIESQCMLITYAICMALLAAAKIFVAVQLYIRLEEMKESVGTIMDQVFVDPQLNVTFHVIETVLSCCGTTGPGAYNITLNGTDYVPYTCCPNPEQQIEEYRVCLKENAVTVGCNGIVTDLIDQLGTTSRNVLIYVIVAEALAMAFAIYISCTIEKRK